MMQFTNAAAAVSWADVVAQSPDVRGTLARLSGSSLGDVSGSEAKDMALTITGKLRNCGAPECELFRCVYGEHSLSSMMDMVGVLSEVLYPGDKEKHKKYMGQIMILLVAARERERFGRIIDRNKIQKLSGVSADVYKSHEWAEAESNTRELINDWLERVNRRLTPELQGIGVI